MKTIVRLTTVRWTPSLIIFILLVGTISLARADSGRSVTVTLENDVLAGTDRHYTHGTRLSYLHRETENSSWMDSILDRCKTGLDIEGKRFGFALGQNLYTPANIATPALILRDRPYAGWLYGALILQRRGTVAEGHVGVLDHFELNLGVVGPESLAEDTQIWWHDVINSVRPLGWDNQLRTEPGLTLMANRSFTLATAAAYSGWGGDLTASVGGAAGNVAVFLNGGLILRVGYRLPRHGSGGPIQPTFSASAFQGRREASLSEAPVPWGFAFFAGIDGRAVGRNLFLDGNTFRSSHRVDKEPIVADLKTGVALQIRRVEITAAYVYRTREFRTQPELNQFGSVSVGYRF